MSRDIHDVEALQEEYSDDFNTFERNFLGSLTDWEGDFTDRQEETLENICGKYGI